MKYRYLILLLLIIPVSSTAFEEHINIKYKELCLGNSKITIEIYENRNKNSYTYFHPHQDEETSVQVTKNIIKKHGGRLISIQHSNPPTRNIDFTLQGKYYSLDPNRMFTKHGIEENLDTTNQIVIKAVQEFANKVANIIFSDMNNNTIFAVHNNYNLNYSVKSYEPGHSLAGDVADIYINPQAGTGEFFYVTDSNIFNIIKENGNFNVVLQDNNKVQDDGSFSVYVNEKGFPYVNVEAQRGNYNQQFAMLEFAVQHIKTALTSS